MEAGTCCSVPIWSMRDVLNMNTSGCYIYHLLQHENITHFTQEFSIFVCRMLLKINRCDFRYSANHSVRLV